ncbi:hypothetical protein AB0M20_44170 [Actinoplanes sp. NPDC051633]|uniref:hypothetical protein n=1 Tax=Actinoplanes sp. NPDC051633 TaxID=3155670 RepID=UPI003412A5D6
MGDSLTLGGTALVGASFALISALALIGSVHPDEKRRADAREVLDRILKLFTRNRR